MTIAETAQAMLDLLDSDGWWHAPDEPNIYVSRSRANCMLTALLNVPGDGLANLRASEAMADVIRAQYPDRLPPWIDQAYEWAGRGNRGAHCSTLVVFFNDHPDTTYDDVRMVLEKLSVS